MVAKALKYCCNKIARSYQLEKDKRGYNFNKYILAQKGEKCYESCYSMLSTLNAIQIIFRKIVNSVRSLVRSLSEIAEGKEKEMTVHPQFN